MISDDAKKAVSGKVPLRFVQIATATEGDSSGMTSTLYGLTAEGEVYQYCFGRETLKTPREMHTATGVPYKANHGPAFYWWQPLRMSAEKGAEYEPPATPKEFL